MPTEYAVCHCGFTKDNHSHFRHEYKETASVMKIQTKGITSFHFSSKDFPELKKERCSKPNCVALKGFHNANTHPYAPEIRIYREVKLALLGTETCNACRVRLKDHHTVMTHSFTTQVVTDKEDKDILTVFYDEDDDVKIILK